MDTRLRLFHERRQNQQNGPDGGGHVAAVGDRRVFEQCRGFSLNDRPPLTVIGVFGV
jgi:hypothetical protein